MKNNFYETKLKIINHVQLTLYTILFLKRLLLLNYCKRVFLCVMTIYKYMCTHGRNHKMI